MFITIVQPFHNKKILMIVHKLMNYPLGIKNSFSSSFPLSCSLACQIKPYDWCCLGIFIF
jgi:hypothetical protein